MGGGQTGGGGRVDELGKGGTSRGGIPGRFLRREAVPALPREEAPSRRPCSAFFPVVPPLPFAPAPPDSCRQARARHGPRSCCSGVRRGCRALGAGVAWGSRGRRPVSRRLLAFGPVAVVGWQLPFPATLWAAARSLEVHGLVNEPRLPAGAAASRPAPFALQGSFCAPAHPPLSFFISLGKGAPFAPFVSA